MKLLTILVPGGGQICPPLLVKNILSPLSHKRIFPDFLTFPKYVLGTPWIIKKIAKKNFLRGAEKNLHWGGRSAPPPLVLLFVNLCLVLIGLMIFLPNYYIFLALSVKSHL